MTKPIVEAGPRARVLVVDDEDVVGRAIKTMLKPYHDVSVVTDARDALALLADRNEQFDVIVCDLMMPQVTGMDFYAELSRAVPEMASKIIFMSGGAFTPRARAFLDDVPNVHIAKPFDPRSLVVLIGDFVQRTKGAPGGK